MRFYFENLTLFSKTYYKSVSHVPNGRLNPRGVTTHLPDARYDGIVGIVGMPDAFAIGLVAFEVALPPAIDEVDDAFALPKVPDELALILLPIIIHNDVIVAHGHLGRHQRVLHPLAMELIPVEVPLIPNPIHIPIEKPMAMHLIIDPIPHIVLSIGTPIHPLPRLLQCPLLDILPNKDVSRLILNFIVFWNFQVGGEAEVVLVVELVQTALLCAAVQDHWGVDVGAGVQQLREVVGVGGWVGTGGAVERVERHVRGFVGGLVGQGYLDWSAGGRDQSLRQVLEGCSEIDICQHRLDDCNWSIGEPRPRYLDCLVDPLSPDNTVVVVIGRIKVMPTHHTQHNHPKRKHISLLLWVARLRQPMRQILNLLWRQIDMPFGPFIPDTVIVTLIVKQVPVSHLHLLIIANIQIPRSDSSMRNPPTLQIIQPMYTLYIVILFTRHNEHKFLLIIRVALPEPIINLLLKIHKHILIHQPQLISTPYEPRLGLFVHAYVEKHSYPKGSRYGCFCSS